MIVCLVCADCYLKVRRKSSTLLKENAGACKRAWLL